MNCYCIQPDVIHPTLWSESQLSLYDARLIDLQTLGIRDINSLIPLWYPVPMYEFTQKADTTAEFRNIRANLQAFQINEWTATVYNPMVSIQHCDQIQLSLYDARCDFIDLQTLASET